SPSCAAIRFRATPAIQSRSTSFTSTIATSRYAIRPSRRRHRRPTGKRRMGQVTRPAKGGYLVKISRPAGGKPCEDLSSGGGKGSDHRHLGGPIASVLMNGAQGHPVTKPPVRTRRAPRARKRRTERGTVTAPRRQRSARDARRDVGAPHSTGEVGELAPPGPGRGKGEPGVTDRTRER